MRPDAHQDAEPRRMIVRTNPVKIPPASPRRMSPRPAHQRPADYYKKFDAEILYYDVFRADGTVLAVGPPLLNVASDIPTWRFEVDGLPAPPPRLHILDRTHRADLRLPPDSSTLSVLGPDGIGDCVSIGDDLASLFAGTRALMTHQLDNDLDWIRDWVRWHVASQGTNSVLVYDNGSTRYTLENLLDAITVPGVEAAAVVDWGFIFGPQGGQHLPWDSDFAQYGAIEHARRRFLRDAAGMLSVDIDELVYSTGNRSAYQCAEESAHGLAVFDGTWTYADPNRPATRPRHADCQWLRTPDVEPPRKWCAAPRRLPERAQLAVHLAHGVSEARALPIRYWHMYPVSTHWKVDRSTVPDDSSAYTHSALIAEQVDRYLTRGEAQRFPPIGRVGLAAARARLRVDAVELWGRRIARRTLRRN